MEEQINPDLQVEHTINDDEPYIIKTKGAIPIVEVELEGKNGLRVMWKGPHETTVEMKHEENGEWIKVPGIQRIEVLVSVTEPLPTIKINQLIIPGIQEKKI